MESCEDPWRTWHTIACSTMASARAVPQYEHIAAPVRFCWAFWRAGYLILLFGEEQRPNSLPGAMRNKTLWLWVILPMTPWKSFSWSFPFPLYAWILYEFVQTLKQNYLRLKNGDTSAAASPKFLDKLCCSLSWPQKSPCFCQKPISFCVCVLDGLSVTVTWVHSHLTIHLLPCPLGIKKLLPFPFQLSTWFYKRTDYLPL